MSRCLWHPSPAFIEKSPLAAFMGRVGQNALSDTSLKTYADIHAWSVTHVGDFWSSVWDFCQVIGDKGDAPFYVPHQTFRQSEFFPQAQLNYAENLLRRRDEKVAITFWAEDQIKTTLTFRELYDQTSQLVQYFQSIGLKKGDRVAAYVPNTPQTLIFMLATATLGAIWSSCSPDFGVKSVLDRFQQIEPTLFISADRSIYKGKSHSLQHKIAEIQSELPTLKQTIVFAYDDTTCPEMPHTHSWDAIKKTYSPQDIQFERFPFRTPLFIAFSSGTTGKPKCIVHGAGGTLIQHMKEHQLHCFIQPNDRVFYYTTCGWMMWNWQVSALASGASLALYDGSPFFPDPYHLFRYTDAVCITLFGTAAKFIEALRKEMIFPKQQHSLESLKLLTSTGSPLSQDGFTYIHHHIKGTIPIASISGGTDILSCFVLGNPISPVYAGHIQGPGLGMDVKIYNDQGQPIVGEKGELVCTTPFPSMPVCFWHDDTGASYEKAYFGLFPNVWCQGDFALQTAEGGFIIEGRSDAVLNPGGVRIGTAEIYRHVASIPQVQESLAVGRRVQGEVHFILFITLQPGGVLTNDLIRQIKKVLREQGSPRHVPDRIIQAPDLPRTKNGKLAELAVRDILHGHPLRNKDALANPDCLSFFETLQF